MFMKSLLLILSLTSNTIPAQKTGDILRIEFNSLTRGYQQLVVITADSIKISTHARGTEENKSIKNKDWIHIIKPLKNVSLSDIAELKSPTMKRAYDGARHSTITITTKSETYSHSFDDEDPHDKLKPLLKIILDTKKKVSK